MQTLQQILTALTALVMALTAQVANLNNINPTSQLAQVISAPTSGLVGYWNFDEGSGTTINDTSGNENAGIINGATWASGKVGSGALSFDGVSNYVSLGSPATLKNLTYPYTISLWFKTTVNQSKILFSLDVNDSNSDQSILLANPSGGNNQWIIAGGKYVNVYSSINNLSDGQWHNLVIERDSLNSLLIYVDGNNFSTNNTSAYSVSGLVIGARGTGAYPFNGAIDEVRIYNRALSTQEIANIYSEGGGSITPPAPEPEPGPISTPTPTNGSCGASVNTCTAGTLSDTADTSSNYLWACQGVNGGTNASCSLPISSTPPPSNGTYVVKQDGSGNYTTIQACANAVKAGETCLVYAGTYPEHISTASGGTSDSNRVNFKAQGTVTMQGFDIKHPYVTVDGFDMTGYYISSFVGMINIWQNADYANILNNTIRENDGVHKVYGVKFERVSGDSANNAVIRNNTIARLNSQYFYVHGSNHLIEQNMMTEARQWDPFLIFGTGHIVRRNVFLNPGTPSGGNHPDYFQTWGASGEPAENILFEENWIQDLPEQLCQLNSSVDGVGDLVNNVKNFTFRRNVVVNVPANCNVDIPGTIWENNTFYRMAYNMSGFIMGGSLTRGNGSSAVFRNNIFLAGGSNSSTANGTNGFYSVDGFLFTREVIAKYVTGEGNVSFPVASGITNDMIANGYIDGAFNGHISASAKALTTIDSMQLNATYSAYKPTLWAKLQESISYDNAMKSAFYADYNYVAGAVSTGYPSKKSSGCVAGGTFTSGNFCEPHGINGGDPKFQNINNPLGIDGIPFTLDDGFKPITNSSLCGKGAGGTEIGAYSCNSSLVFAGSTSFTPPPPKTPPPSPTSDLLLKIDFENYTPSSGTVADKSGTGNNGACNYNLGQCPVIGTGPNGSVAAGFFGAYPDAVNSGDYVNINKSDSLTNLSKGTVLVWAKYSSTSSDRSETLLDGYLRTGQDSNGVDTGTPGTWSIKRNFYQNNGLWMFNDLGNRVQLLAFPDSAVYTAQLNGTAGWHQYAFSWDGINMKGYYDGTLFNTVPQTGISAFNLGYYLAIGANGHNSMPESWAEKYPNHGFTNGYLDEIRIYNRALSSSEISSLYSVPANNPTPTTPDPILPVISNLLGTNITSNSAQISWNTNIATNAQIFHGTTASYGTQSSLIDNTNKTLSHSATLTSLAPSTLYHFKVTSIDVSGNSISSGDFTFTTLALSQPVAPVTTPSPVTTSSGGSGVGSSGGGGGGSPVTVYIPPAATSTSISNNLTSTPDQLQSLLASLLKQVADLQAQLAAKSKGTTTSASINTTFSKNLSIGMTSQDVKALQQFLNTSGFIISQTGVGSTGKESTLFGMMTYKALVKYQKSVGLPATGFFGPMTRAYVNKK